MRCFIIGFTGFFVAAIATAVAFAAYGDYSARASLGETISGVIPLRTMIAEDLLSTADGSVSEAVWAQAMSESSNMGVSYLKVSPDGTIAFRSAKHGQIIIYEPDTSTNGIEWRCIGAPAKDVPPDCR